MGARMVERSFVIVWKRVHLLCLDWRVVEKIFLVAWMDRDIRLLCLGCGYCSLEFVL